MQKVFGRRSYSLSDSPTWDVSTQGRYSELFLLNCLLKGLFIPDVPNLKVKQKTGSIPQSHIKKAPAATNQNVETTYSFKFGWWVGECCSQVCLPVYPCFQPLILTVDANSLKNVPTKHLHLNKWKKVILKSYLPMTAVWGGMFHVSLPSWQHS